MKNIVIGIDASRCRSGGAREHLIGILENLHPSEFEISQIHVWSYAALLDSLPNFSWLVKHSESMLEGSIIKQFWWQYFNLNKELRKFGCNILFTSDASSLCFFVPSVVLSQDLLSYEPGALKLFRYGKHWIRLHLIRLLQTAAFQRAQGVIFLTNYAAKMIQKVTGTLDNFQVVNHGVSNIYKTRTKKQITSSSTLPEIDCVYVSHASMYKHQWEVIKGIEVLRNRGYSIQLTLIGGGAGAAQARIIRQCTLSDPKGNFVKQLPFLSQEHLLIRLLKSDCFIYASSCEAFGITLLEGMAMGLPIAASNRSSIPETLCDGGVYFDPENPLEIAAAVEKIIQDPDYSNRLVLRAHELAKKYSWERCSRETWGFIVDTYRKIAKP